MSDAVNIRLRLIRSRINLKLKELNLEEVELYELDDKIQQALDEMIGELRPEAWLNIPLKIGQEKYPVSNCIIRKGIRTNFNASFEMYEWETFELLSLSGLPTAGSINAGYLFVKPIPTADNLNLTLPVNLIKSTIPISDINAPELPEIFDSALIYKVLANKFPKPNEFEADYYMNFRTAKTNYYTKDTFQRVPECNW